MVLSKASAHAGATEPLVVVIRSKIFSKTYTLLGRYRCVLSTLLVWATLDGRKLLLWDLGDGLPATPLERAYE